VRINEELLGRKVAVPVYKTEINEHATLLCPQKLAINFVGKWRLLSRYSPLADYPLSHYAIKA
jgi:hypothetical protein